MSGATDRQQVMDSGRVIYHAVYGLAVARCRQAHKAAKAAAKPITCHSLMPATTVELSTAKTAR